MMKRRTRIAGTTALLLALLLSVGAVGARYRSDLRASREATTGATIAETACGPIEYATRGEGPPALMIHGAGGGYDQGLLLAQALGGELRWIVPSRFGYLGTPMPGDASTPMQADAHACLLDALGIQRAAVVGLSAGGPSALQLVLRHPERSTALVMMCAVSRQDPPRGPLAELAYRVILTSDFPFWIMNTLARSTLTAMLGVDRETQARLSPRDAELIARMLASIHPVAARRTGILFDMDRLVEGPYPLERIRAPTLVVHARDDALVPVGHGEHTARGIPGARAILLEEGGHMGYAFQSGVLSEIREFLERHAIGYADTIGA
jgi:pimeloyl-ACP methyl ester carboxylesterase